MPIIGPDRILGALREMKFPNTFNPYVEQCEVYDKADAPQLRARLLREILGAASDVDIDSIWIGRDLGHRGGRRTGLALTDDFRFSDHTRRWGIEIDRPTEGRILRERTAGVVWEMLENVKDHVFLWNVFPLHPFPDDDVFKNRPHSAVERKAGQRLLLMLFALLRPRRVVAVGNDAARALGNIVGDRDICHVRHPSYGGENVFRAQIAALYGIRSSLR